MPHQHLIRWRGDGSTEWLTLSSEGRILQGRRPGLPDQPAERLLVLLPAEEVLLLEAPRVARNVHQLAQALPFAIEDQLAGPVESLHVAFDANAAGETVAAAVIHRARLQALIEQLAAAGLRADAVYSELQCLPTDPELVWMLAEGDRRLIRKGRSEGLVLSASEYEQAAPWLAANALQAAPAQCLSLDAELIGFQRIDGEPLAWWAQQVVKLSGPNLLQGLFAAPQKRAAVLAPWRWAAILAAVALLLGLGGLGLERHALQQHVQSRQAEMEQLLRQALPQVQRIVDPVAQLRAALKGSGAGAGDALALISRIAPVLNSGAQVVVDGMEYRGGVLELVVMTPDVASLDSLRERLTSLALQVDLTAAQPGSRGVEGRLRIRGAGA